MSSKAPRIPESTWNGYRDEITALYTAPDGTLAKVMETMKEKYGFQPTENQYATKFTRWGLRKYAKGSEWLYVDQKLRKRDSEGKDSEINIHGRKRSRSEAEKEIARNVTFTSRLQRAEDLPTPEGVEVFTPGTDESSNTVTHQEEEFSNLPLFRLERDLQILLVPRFYDLVSLLLINEFEGQLGRLHKPQFAAELLQMALGDVLQLDDSNVFVLIRDPATGEQRRRYVAAYFPPSNAEIGSIYLPVRLDGFGMPPQLAAVQVFLQSFVCLTNNDALEDSHIFNIVNWLLKRFKSSLFTYIFELHTTTSKIFMRKIFPAFVNTGNTKLVEEILDRRLTFNKHCNDRLPWFPDRLQEDCVTIAIQNQDHRMLKLLCRAGFHPRFRLGDEDSLLSRKNLPWNTNNLKILHTLIAFNADPDCMLTDVERGFPLVNAAESGNLGAVDWLLKAGSTVNVYVKDYLGTPLQAAAHAERMEMAKFLIVEGADVNAPYAEQYKLKDLDWASTYQLKSNIRKRYQSATKTPIQIACELNNIPMVELLLDHGALVDLSPLSRLTAKDMPDTADTEPLSDYSIGYSPNYKNIPYHTALQYSVQNRNMFLVRRLLSEGADPDLRVISDWGDTPLQMAARLNYPEIVSILMESKADVNASAGMINGRTALQAAAESGNIQTVRMFLSQNADVNAPAGERRGLTALQAAVHNGHSEIVELLLRSNADINAPSSPNAGLSAITAAMSQRNLPMLKFLIEHGAKDTDRVPAICAAAIYNWVDGARYLLKHGSDVNSIYYGRYYYNHDGDRVVIRGNIRPLAQSIINQDPQMVKFLLDSGAEVNFHSNGTLFRQNDALSLAICQISHREIILSLCPKYANPSQGLEDHALAFAVTYIYEKPESDDVVEAVKCIISGFTEESVSHYDAVNRLAHHIGDSCMDEAKESRLEAAVKFLLELTPSRYMRMWIRISLLQLATKNRKIRLAEYLLEVDVDIPLSGYEKTGTALQEAITVGELHFARRLLERGAHANTLLTLTKGPTPLQAAARTGNINIAVELLRRGAHVAAAPSSEGTTAINAAAESGREDMLQLLLDHYDGDQSIRQVCQEAATCAEKSGHPEIAEWLQGYAVPRVRELGDTNSSISENEIHLFRK